MDSVWDGARLCCYFKSSPGDFNVQPMLRTAGLDGRFWGFVFPQGLNQWSSNFECASESVGELVTIHVAGSTLRVSDSAGLELA